MAFILDRHSSRMEQATAYITPIDMAAFRRIFSGLPDMEILAHRGRWT